MDKSIITIIAENPTKYVKNNNIGEILHDAWLNDDDRAKFNCSVKLLADVGGEGQGDARQVVYQLSIGDESVIIADDGYYDSYNGTEWDGRWYVAEPYEVTETRYKKVTK